LKTLSDLKFEPAIIKKELINVDSEFKMDLNNGGWQTYLVMRYLADPTHPFHNFPIGSTWSLNKTNISELAANYYK
jgi:secreted Zn-dependent insulinase-like peptidase